MSDESNDCSRLSRVSAARLNHLAEERTQRRPAFEVRASDPRPALQFASCGRAIAPSREALIVHVAQAERRTDDASQVDVCENESYFCIT